MEFFQRPIKNIRTIDIGQILFVGLGVSILLISTFGFSELTKLGSALNFIFSFSLNNPIILEETSSQYLQSLYNTYELLIIAKILFWTLIFVGVLRFLFKKPTLSDEQNIENTY